MTRYRIERDALGEVKVPVNALYGAHTQRALENFPASGIKFPRVFIRALGLIKAATCEVNNELGLLDDERSRAIRKAAFEVAEGKWNDQFPLDIFQTGSATSTNMNANEVIAARARQLPGSERLAIHPNDHVNMSQSSNDVIPSAIHVAAFLQVKELLLPSLAHLHAVLKKREEGLHDVIKTGRTHLMDAMPIRFSQEINGWAYQVEQSMERIKSCEPRLAKLAIGGTAVGTGVNAPRDFGKRVAAKLAKETNIPFIETENHFAAQATLDTAVELSGHLKATASSLLKIANDLRWLNSGPVAGLGEIALPELQAGSSIMPGKVNPVMCEMMMMASTQVMGNDTAIAISNSYGNFELNVMMPVIAHNLLESITILGNVARFFADNAVAGFTVNKERVTRLVDQNPMLATALSPQIGYDKTARIVKKAYAEGRTLKEVAAEMTDLSKEELDRLLDPSKMTGE